MPLMGSSDVAPAEEQEAMLGGPSEPVEEEEV